MLLNEGAVITPPEYAKIGGSHEPPIGYVVCYTKTCTIMTVALMKFRSKTHRVIVLLLRLSLYNY